MQVCPDTKVSVTSALDGGGLFCSRDLDPMTFIYEPDPYSVEIYPMCKYELRTSRL